jgi:hypothetical protein
MYLAKPPFDLAAALAPSHADWLNDLSSTFPVSVTKPMQKSFPVPQSLSDAALDGAANHESPLKDLWH